MSDNNNFRKRKISINNWKTFNAKTKRNKGESYVSSVNNSLIKNEKKRSCLLRRSINKGF